MIVFIFFVKRLGEIILGSLWKKNMGIYNDKCMVLLLFISGLQEK